VIHLDQVQQENLSVSNRKISRILQAPAVGFSEKKGF
jgi:hypothetical protein